MSNGTRIRYSCRSDQHRCKITEQTRAGSGKDRKRQTAARVRRTPDTSDAQPLEHPATSATSAPSSDPQPQQPATRRRAARPGKPVKGFGGGRYKLTAQYLFFEKGSLRTDSQQVPIAQVLDVDINQSMTQKARQVATIRVHIQRPQRVEIVLMEDVPDFREGQRLINETAHSARAALSRQANTRHFEGAAPGVPAAAPAAAPVETPAAVDPMAQLRQLGELNAAGVLTDEEFAAKKAEILARL